MALTDEDLLAISQLLDMKLDSKLKAELQPVKDSIKDIQAELKTVKQDLGDVKQDLDHVKLHLENVTDRNIQLLAENYVPAAKRYERESALMKAMQDDVDILKKVTAEHSRKIQKIS